MTKAPPSIPEHLEKPLRRFIRSSYLSSLRYSVYAVLLGLLFLCALVFESIWNFVTNNPLFWRYFVVIAIGLECLKYHWEKYWFTTRKGKQLYEALRYLAHTTTPQDAGYLSEILLYGNANTFFQLKYSSNRLEEETFGDLLYENFAFLVGNMTDEDYHRLTHRQVKCFHRLFLAHIGFWYREHDDTEPDKHDLMMTQAFLKAIPYIHDYWYLPYLERLSTRMHEAGRCMILLRNMQRTTGKYENLLQPASLPNEELLLHPSRDGGEEKDLLHPIGEQDKRQ